MNLKYLLLGIGVAGSLMYQPACFPRQLVKDTNLVTLYFGSSRELSDIIELDTNEDTKYYKIIYDKDRNNIKGLQIFNKVIIDLKDNSVEIQK